MISPVFGILLASYLIGSIPTGYWLGRVWKGVDVREHGSGNLGATNVFRVLGTAPGVITLIIDIVKGAGPVLWVKYVFPGMLSWAVAAGLAAIVGHTVSVFVKFKGGKGVATSAGVFLALLPIPSVIALSAFGLCLAVTRMVSLSSIVSAMILTIAAFVLSPERLLAYTALAVTGLVILKHRGNIQRICAGTEPHIDRKGTA